MKDWVILAFFLFLAGIMLCVAGEQTDAIRHPIAHTLLLALGGAIVSLGFVEVLHEYFVARKIRAEFLVLADFLTKGIQRICDEHEVEMVGAEEIKRTRSLGVMGLGLGWLCHGPNHEQLLALLADGCSVRILIPDPTAGEIVERYADEPASFELGLPGLAGRVGAWMKLQRQYPALEVHVYDRYPVATVTIYDSRLMVAPVLFKRRTKDNMTAVFCRPSSAAHIYEDHFKKVWDDGSRPLDDNIMARVEAAFPVHQLALQA